MFPKIDVVSQIRNSLLGEQRSFFGVQNFILPGIQFPRNV